MIFILCYWNHHDYQRKEALSNYVNTKLIVTVNWKTSWDLFDQRSLTPLCVSLYESEGDKDDAECHC